MSERFETGPAQRERNRARSEGEITVPRSRRPYHPPRLECHGRLAELTRFGGSQIIDSGGGLGNQP